MARKAGVGNQQIKAKRREVVRERVHPHAEANDCW